ncbi:unnamed protein product [Hermetia illucens]|uniref:Ionotropic receptor n=1 Tax=Hermetia illucens TaxID=343691 RepID=A0A7R8YY29_HERIL|nr:unnamed protein product [Hermetia illucens]
MLLVGVYCLCLAIHQVSSSYYMGVILEASRFSQNFAIFTWNDSQVDLEVNSLIQELYRSGNTSGFIISPSNDGAVWDGIAFKPLLVVVSLCDENLDMMFSVLTSFFRKFQKLKVIFIAMCKLTTDDKIPKSYIFNWCWRNGIIDVIIILPDKDERMGNVFTYTLHHQSKALERKDNLTHHELFPGKLENLMGYPVNVMLQPSSGQFKRIEVPMIILMQFIKKLNGTWADIGKTFPADMESIDIQEYIEQRGIDFVLFRSKSTLKRKVSNTKSCLIVPRSRIKDTDIINSANILICGAVMVVFTILVKIVIESRRLKSRINEMQSICGSMAKRRTPSFTLEHRGRLYRLKIDLFCCSIGIMVMNLYAAYITSEATTFELNENIKSFEDLRRRGLKVMISEDAPLSFFDLRTWYDILLDTPYEALLSHVFGFNNSYGYFVEKDHLQIIMGLQQILGKTVYQDMKLCLFTMGGSEISVRNNSPYIEVLDRFLGNMYSAGLRQKWIKDEASTVAFELKRKHFQCLENFEENEEVDTSHDVRLLVSLMLVGTITSLGVFIMECLIYRWKLCTYFRKGWKYLKGRCCSKIKNRFLRLK